MTHQNSGSNKANGWERIFSSDRNETSGFGGNYQIDGKAQAYNANDIENAKSAQEVARYMLLTEMGLPAPTDASEDLINEIIQHNPSVFNKDGSVKENADWTKLDLPTAEYLKQKGYNVNQQTSLTRKETQKQKINYDSAESIKTALEAKGNQNVKVKYNTFANTYDIQYTDTNGKTHNGRYTNSNMSNIQGDVRGLFSE